MTKLSFNIIRFVCLFLILLMGCEKKEDPNMKKVYYASQPGYGGGANPNPNGVSGSGCTATGTTTPTCTRSMIVNGSIGTSLSSSSGTTGTYYITLTSSLGTVTINFGTASAPASGTYNIVTSGPLTNECMVAFGGTNAVSGQITVTTGSIDQASLLGIVCGTNTVSATACY